MCIAAAALFVYRPIHRLFTSNREHMFLSGFGVDPSPSLPLSLSLSLSWLRFKLPACVRDQRSLTLTIDRSGLYFFSSFSLTTNRQRRRSFRLSFIIILFTIFSLLYFSLLIFISVPFFCSVQCSVSYNMLTYTYDVRHLQYYIIFSFVIF